MKWQSVLFSAENCKTVNCLLQDKKSRKASLLLLSIELHAGQNYACMRVCQISTKIRKFIRTQTSKVKTKTKQWPHVTESRNTRRTLLTNKKWPAKIHLHFFKNDVFLEYFKYGIKNILDFIAFKKKLYITERITS